MKKVSVVVPCYNVCDWLDVCMSHLLRQTIGRGNMEIILVDDASTDDGATWELILQYERNYPDVVIAVHLEEECQRIQSPGYAYRMRRRKSAVSVRPGREKRAYC